MQDLHVSEVAHWPERPTAMQLWDEYISSLYRRNFCFQCPHTASYFLVNRFGKNIKKYKAIKPREMQQFIDNLEAELVTKGWVKEREE